MLRDFKAFKAECKKQIRPETMSDKVLEKTEFTRSEMYVISAIFPEVDMKYLFDSNKK